MHICIVWFAKVENTEIIRSNRRLGDFLLGEADSGSKRIVWSERWLESFIQFKTTFFYFFLIQGITLKEFDKLSFDMILMSPPCQPFTR